MKIEVSGASPLELEASVLAVPVFEEDLPDGKGLLAELDRRLDGHVSAAAAEEDFQGKVGQSLGLRTLGKLRAARVLLVGLGKRDGAEAALPRAGFEPLRTAAGEASRQAQKNGATRLAFAAPRLPGQTAHEARAIVEGALLGAYRFDRYKTDDKKKKARKLETLVVVVPQGLERSKEVKESVALARSVAGAVAWARDRVNEPPLHLTPSRLADAARDGVRWSGGSFTRSRAQDTAPATERASATDSFTSLDRSSPCGTTTTSVSSLRAFFFLSSVLYRSKR